MRHNGRMSRGNAKSDVFSYMSLPKKRTKTRTPIFSIGHIYLCLQEKTVMSELCTRI